MGIFRKKIFLIGFIALLLAAIPLTLFILQKQQETRSRAAAATVLQFIPTPINTTVDGTFSVDVMAKPGSNQLTAIKLNITYDPTKVATATGTCSDSFCPNAATMPVVDGPTYTSGNIFVTFSIGADPTKIIQADTKLATITFKALSPTAPGKTTIAFAPSPNTEAKSGAPTDTTSENVIASTQPADVVIAQSSVSTTPTPTLNTTITPTSTPSAGNQVPICSALNVDRDPTGAAPFSITFTAIGNDTDGTINKASFDFNDGPLKDVTTGGGIGTNSLNLQIAHTYNNAGTYTAKVTLTDNNAGVSQTTNCTKTITVQPAPTGTSGSGSTATPTPIAQATETPNQIIAIASPTITPVVITTKAAVPVSGPGDTFVGIGTGALILTVIAGLLFFIF